MTDLFSLDAYHAEALLVCLAASVFWAGALLIGARRIERTSPSYKGQQIWTTTLLFAVLPTLAAPVMANLGISLRPETAFQEFSSMESSARAVTPKLNWPNLSSGPPTLTREKLIGAAIIIYFYGLFLIIAGWVVRQLCLRYAAVRARSVNDEALMAEVAAWAERFNVRLPTIRRSRHVSSVCVMGAVRPTLLIPQGIEWRISRADLVLMCAHELAHVKRGDTRLFTATALARMLLWFNPLVSRIAANVELAAEECADALVLERGVDRRAYAACFVEGLKFAALKVGARPALAAPSFTPAGANARRRRLNSILDARPRRQTPLTSRIALSAAASGAALLAVGQAALSVDADAARERRFALRSTPLAGDVTVRFGEIGISAIDGVAHGGVDIKAPEGALVSAHGNGVVIEATDRYVNSPAWGKVVVIDHGRGLVTRHAHPNSYVVRKGAPVRAGEPIAAVGATGKVTGPRLHFEILQDGKEIDPANLFSELAPTKSADVPFGRSTTVEPTTGTRTVAPPKLADLPTEPAEPSQPAIELFAETPTIAAADIERSGSDNPPIAADNTLNRASFEIFTADLERRLLGAANGEIPGAVEITLRDGKTVRRFSSNGPVAAERRAELRAAMKAMSESNAQAQQGAQAYRDVFRRDLALLNSEHARHASGAMRPRFGADDFRDELRARRQERRDLLTDERDALQGARSDLEEQIEGGLAEALADLGDAAQDLLELELEPVELEAAQDSIRSQREELIRMSAVHERAIAAARIEVDRELARIDRLIADIDNENGGD